MVRFRRIEERDRVFFVTTNLGRGVASLSPSDRDLILKTLGALRRLRAFSLFGYVVMPDHNHLLLAPQEQTLTRILRDLKSETGYEIARRRSAGPIWQSRYFDNIIRQVRDFWKKLEYIHQNPVEAGLVRQAQDWKWSSYRFYAKTGCVPVVPDPVNLPTDGNALLWPAPWR